MNTQFPPAFLRDCLTVTAFISVIVFTAQAKEPIDCIVSPDDDSTSNDTRTSNDPFIAHDTDLSIPPPTRLSWSVNGDSLPREYAVFVSENRYLLSRNCVASNLPSTSLNIWNLKIGTRYYWQIGIADSVFGNRLTGFASFQTPPLWPRMLFIEGVTNVRDIGGRKNESGIMIPQGLFFRSSEFNEHHIITQRGIRQLLDIGVVFEIDLRNDWENAIAALPPSVRYFRPPNPNGITITGYREGLIYNADQYRDVFKELSKKENYPMVCHCRAGADRTGTVSALLEAILGCSQQQMAEDFVWTSLSVYGVRDSAGDSWRGLMDEIKSYDKKNGSVFEGTWNYLRAKGLTNAELIGIRTIFLNDTTAPFPDPDTPAVITTISKVIHSRHISPIVMVDGMNRIKIGREVKRLELYDLQGRKFWSFERKTSGMETTAPLPKRASGLRLLYYVNEKNGPNAGVIAGLHR